MFKRHYIDEIEYLPSPICGEKPKFESNITSFQFRQNASAFWRGISCNPIQILIPITKIAIRRYTYRGKQSLISGVYL